MKRLLQKRGWNNLFQPVFGTTCPKPAKRIAALVAAFLILAPPSAQAIIDTNNNGVSDLHERQFNNGDLFTTFDPQADPDGDGWTNEQEAAAGTDPFDANPPNGFIRPETQRFPAIWGDDNGQPVLLTPESLTLTWPVITGKQYSLQFSLDLSAGSWSPVGEPFIAGGAATYGFPIDDADKCFWRVAVMDVDIDGDGLTNHEEHEIGTNPDLADSDNDGVSDGDEVIQGTNPSSSSSYSLAWRRVERNLDYDFTLAAPPQTSTGTLALSASWDSALNTTETLTSPIPFTTLKDRLETISFPGAVPASASTGLSPASGNATVPLLLTRNANLKHQRIWLTRDPAKDFTIAKKAVVFTDRTLNGVQHLPNFEIKTFTLPTNQTTSNSVDLEDGFTSDGPSNGSNSPPGSSNIAHLEGHLEKFTKQLVPVQVDDNQFATGVDNVSITAATSDIGYQEKFWIMAPTGNAPTGLPCSNAMKFNIPFVPAVEMEIVPPDAPAPTAIPIPSTFTLSAARPCIWRGSGTVSADLDMTWKLGLAGPPAGPKQSVELPIGVKTMKRRTVKVAVYPVTQHSIGGAFSPPDITAFTNKLNEVFAYQTNAWFELHYQPLVRLPLYLNGNTYLYPNSVEENDLHTNIRDRNNSNEDYDIVLILINDVDFQQPPVPVPGGFRIDPVKGHMLSSRAAVVCSGYHSLTSPITPETVMDTAAHEIGHVMLGENAHPDENEGRAPLKGTDRTQRLMCSGHTRSLGAKLLVKKEWDRIEDWLVGNPDVRENRNN